MLFNYFGLPACMLIIVSLIIDGCVSDHFWYPVKKYDVACAEWSGEVYLMASSKGWRSWPYYLDPVEEQEISLGSGCIKHLELEFPRVDGFPTSGIRARLSDEQRANIVEGF